jgi:Flp pilus assembly pilin Flp
MKNLMTAVRKFGRDDSGNQAVSDVAILAVGAIVLLAVLVIWKDQVRPAVKDGLNKVLTFDGSGAAATPGGGAKP